MANRIISFTDYDDGIGREISALRGFALLLELAGEFQYGMDGKMVADVAQLANLLVKNIESKSAEIEEQLTQDQKAS